MSKFFALILAGSGFAMVAFGLYHPQSATASTVAMAQRTSALDCAADPSCTNPALLNGAVSK